MCGVLTGAPVMLEVHAQGGTVEVVEALLGLARFEGELTAVGNGLGGGGEAGDAVVEDQLARWVAFIEGLEAPHGLLIAVHGEDAVILLAGHEGGIGFGEEVAFGPQEFRETGVRFHG
ncbi:MAG TPA: hypothetical protein DEW46_08745 [Verrucomicrobia bacterium]|nr:hypothetical protein [Verrucomicrobiota bacterium]